jgi:hypothetical protein
MKSTNLWKDNLPINGTIDSSSAIIMSKGKSIPKYRIKKRRAFKVEPYEAQTDEANRDYAKHRPERRSSSKCIICGSVAGNKAYFQLDGIRTFSNRTS